MRPNEPMTADIIDRMLTQNAPPLASAHQKLAWERGYLTGLLMYLCNEYTVAHRAVRERLQD